IPEYPAPSTRRPSWRTNPEQWHNIPPWRTGGTCPLSIHARRISLVRRSGQARDCFPWDAPESLAAKNRRSESQCFPRPVLRHPSVSQWRPQGGRRLQIQRRRRNRKERRGATALSRSEEHTSELQSLMRISYAVFCLKKKKRKKPQKKTYE